MDNHLRGTVVKTTGSWYAVRLEDGSIVQSRIKGKFRLEGKKLTNPVAVGDIVVLLEDADTGDLTISEIESRRNYVIRQSPRKKHDLHLIASNIDQAVLVVTIVQPMLKQGFIDRFLLMTEPHDIPVHIVFNKADVYSDEDREVYGGLKYIYEEIGYPCHLVSSLTGEGVEEVREVLKGKVTLTGGSVRRRQVYLDQRHSTGPATQDYRTFRLQRQGAAYHDICRDV